MKKKNKSQNNQKNRQRNTLVHITIIFLLKVIFLVIIFKLYTPEFNPLFENLKSFEFISLIACINKPCELYKNMQSIIFSEYILQNSVKGLGYN